MNLHFHWLARFYDRLLPFTRLEQMLKLLDLPHPGGLLDAGGRNARTA